MLTEDETRVMAHAYALRHDEEPDKDLWFCPDDWLLPECHRLVERGYLQRRWHGDDMVYRLTDAMLTAQELSGLLNGADGREN
jgi:hypothetical protein